MAELTFRIEYINLNYKELEKYITSLKGVFEVKVNPDKDEVYIKYDSNLISIKILILEVKMFLSLTKTPSIIFFNKYSKQNTSNAFLKIEDACCEYCLKGIIEELILLNGIERASADFDCNNFFNVSIEIEYDKNIFSENDIRNLENKFNSN